MKNGNTAVSAAISISATPYAKLRGFAKLLSLQIPSHQTHHRRERLVTFPCIGEAFSRNMNSVHSEIKDNQESNTNEYLQLAGDGSFDSAGHCAQYCVYVFMDFATNKVVHVVLKRKTDPGMDMISQRMEPKCFEEGLDYLLLDVGLRIGTVVTDQHASIAKCLREKHPGIHHEFDDWHIIRSKVSHVDNFSAFVSCTSSLCAFVIQPQRLRCGI